MLRRAGKLRGKHLLGVSTPSLVKVRNISMVFFVPTAAAVSGQNQAGKPGGRTHLGRQRGPGLFSCFPSPVWVFFQLTWQIHGN